jgi:hypothetical protein
MVSTEPDCVDTLAQAAPHACPSVMPSHLGVYTNIRVSARNIASDLLIFYFPLKKPTSKDADIVFIPEFVDELQVMQHDRGFSALTKFDPGIDRY